MKFKFIKSIFIFIIFNFLILFSNNYLFADDLTIGDRNPCTEYWPNVEWIGPNLLTLNLDGCVYIIEYYYRQTGLGPRYELQIVGIYKIFGDNCPTTNKDLRAAAYARLWDVNDMGFPAGDYEYIANESTCTEIKKSGGPIEYTLIVPNDLVSMIDTTGLTYTISPNNDLLFSNVDYWLGCFDDVCCWAYYDITRGNGHVVKVEWVDIGGGLSQPECDDPSRCSPGCDNLKFNWYADGYEPKKILNIKENPNNIFSSSCILPNPNKGIFILKYKSLFIGEINLLIYNSDGKEIYNKMYQKKTNNFDVHLNFNNITNGKYFYIIKENGLKKSNGNLIINK